MGDRTQRGNIFLALFAAVAFAALLSYAVSQFIRGPLTTSTNLTRTNTAQQQMNAAGQLIITTSALEANSGDCDSDTYIEPIDPADPTTNPKPTNGGIIPATIGATKRDPWGTLYGYCAWNHGATLTGGGCTRTYVLSGVANQTQAVIALVSAGKDKTFQTTCTAYVDTTPADGSPDTALVAKTVGSDDIIVQYTYGEAQAVGGDLWILKSGDPDIATIAKDVEIASNQTLQFADDARLLIPTDVELTDAECTGTAASQVNEKALRLNTTTSPPSLEVCYDTDATVAYAWDWGSAAGSSGGAMGIDDLSDGIADYATLYNVFLGDLTGTSTTTGTSNTALGYRALNTNVAKSGSTAIGYEAMRYADSGAAGTPYNTAVGYQALRGSTTAANNTGTSNTAIGYGVLMSNTDGGGNVAIGSTSISTTPTMGSNTDGDGNIAIGLGALSSNVAKSGSVAIGWRAMYYADSTAIYAASFNTAIGSEALRGSGTPANNTGDGNTAIGNSVLKNITSGTSNVGVGSMTYGSNATLDLNTTGSQNIAMGVGALATNVAGSGSIAIGHQAMYYANSTAVAAWTYNTAVGYQALMGSSTAASNTGTQNTAMGHSTLVGNTSGQSGSAFGYAALYSNTTGRYNSGFGSAALTSNTAGWYNTAVGTSALNSNIGANGSTAVGYYAMVYANSTAVSTTTYNTAVGMYALRGSSTPANNTGIENTAIGYASIYSNTSGVRNTALGVNTLLSNTTGQDNTAIGYTAMYGSSGTITGSYNVGIGSNALYALTTGDSNVVVGAGNGTTTGALSGNTTGSQNVALGYGAGAAGTANTTGSNNTWVGYQAQSDANNYTNGTALGNGAILTASNRIVLGNTSIASIYAQVTSITGISDARRKHDIHDIPLGLDFIQKLRPVEYKYNNGDDTVRYGFLAQETAAVLPDSLRPQTLKNENGLALLSRDKDKDHTYRMAYGELIAPLVKAVQEQQVQIDRLKSGHSVSGGGDAGAVPVAPTSPHSASPSVLDAPKSLGSGWTAMIAGLLLWNIGLTLWMVRSRRAPR